MVPSTLPYDLFQSIFPVGGIRYENRLAPYKAHFNPFSLCGEIRYVNLPVLDLPISIHSPHEGRYGKSRSLAHRSLHFNPLFP